MTCNLDKLELVRFLRRNLPPIMISPSQAAVGHVDAQERHHGLQTSGKNVNRSKCRTRGGLIMHRGVVDCVELTLTPQKIAVGYRMQALLFQKSQNQNGIYPRDD